jgi:RimJ/RimL family protein N-acetyltransferase
MLRFDREGERVEISIYLFAGQVGIGWGQVLLASAERYLRQHWPDVRLIEAQVMAGNSASIALFQKAGYHQADSRFQRVISDE